MRLEKQYTGLSIEEGKYVFYNGELQFNIEGYNLLFNLYRLCETLKYELR